MLTVETIRKVRLSIHRDGKSIRQTARDFHLSRNTVRKVIRSDQTAFSYTRKKQPRPKLGPHIEWIKTQLEADLKLPKRQRRTAQILYEQLQAQGYDGGYRFAQLSSHYLFEPVACSPAAGWEKGQVENQVGVIRKRFFTPRIRVADFEQLNGQLKAHCIGWAKTHRHPEHRNQSIWQIYEDEKKHLHKPPSAFDGYAERPARVSPSSLVNFDRNRYSTDCRYAGRTVQLRAYADRIVIVKDTVVIGAHQRQFGRDKNMFDPWHYLPVLERKPGVLRNGAPFKDWDLPESITRVGLMLKNRYNDWDRQFVGILSVLPLYGVDAVEHACKQAISAHSVSKEVVLNYLNRSQDHDPIDGIIVPDHLVLKQAPVADCRRYEDLVGQVHHVTR